MLQQRRRVNLPVVGTILLGLLAGVYLFAWKRFAKPSLKVVKHKVETSPDQALKYWTADKMRDAIPAPMPHVSKPGQGKRRPRRPARPPRSDEA